MTSLTGKTQMTLPGTLVPPTFIEAISGAILSNAAILYVWTRHTTAGNCWAEPVRCVTGEDAWARQVVLSLLLNFSVWVYSLRTLPSRGTSDPSIVDRLWSLTPWLTCCHWLLCMDASSPGLPRVLLMTLLSTARSQEGSPCVLGAS